MQCYQVDNLCSEQKTRALTTANLCLLLVKTMLNTMVGQWYSLASEGLTQESQNSDIGSRTNNHTTGALHL